MQAIYCYKMTKSVGNMTTIVFQKIEKNRKHRFAYAMVDDKVQDVDFSSVAYPMPGVLEYTKDKKDSLLHNVSFKDIEPAVFDAESKKISEQFFELLKDK